MTSFWRQPLRRQLLIAISLLLVPVFVTAIWSGFVTLRERSAELQEQVRFVARTTAAYVERDIVNLDTVAQRASTEPVVAELDPLQATDLFTRTAAGRPAILRMVLTGADGAIVAETGGSAEPLDAGHWAADVVRLRRRVVVPMRVTPQRHLAYCVVAYPVYRGGTVVGALGVYLNLGSLQDAFSSLPLPEGSVINIADAEGRILARNIDAPRYTGQFLFREHRTPGTLLASEERQGIDGVSRLYAEAMVAAGPWIVNVGVPSSIAMNGARSVWLRSSSILIVGLVGWLLLAYVLTRRLDSAVSHLDAAAKRIAGGDLRPMERRPMLSREFSDLQDAFDEMLRRLHDSRRALDAQMAEERRIREELESLQGQVIRQERLAAVGQLVSGVAHEINNPLQAILGFAELLQMQHELPEAVKGDLRLIQKESARACGIIRNLAMFARQQPGEAAPVVLSDVIRSVAELRQRRLESEEIELIVDDRSTSRVLAVLTELQQVVLNFVVNAEQAILMSGRLPGRITIRTYDSDRRAVLEVEDTGPGLASENEAKLFQPFFTTKPVGQGTGLGLSVSYGIIDSLSGHIGYRRAAAGGAIFYFDLPVANDRQG